MSVRLERVGDGVWRAPGTRVMDRSGRGRLAMGRSDYVVAAATGTLVDKTALIADVLDSGCTATLLCRPRRFGKSLNITMMRAFFEAPEAGGLAHGDAEALFSGTDVWGADGGWYRRCLGACPVVHLSLGTVTAPAHAADGAALRDVGLRGPDFQHREEGLGRYDIRLEPDPRVEGRFARGPRPLVTLEAEFGAGADDARPASLAREALAQIGERSYDAGRVRWGVAFAGKRVAVAYERA